jgi:hypothetical protein
VGNFTFHQNLRGKTTNNAIKISNDSDYIDSDDIGSDDIDSDDIDSDDID